MKGIFKYVIIAAIAYLAIWFFIRSQHKKKYLNFLTGELGMKIAEDFSLDELKTAYIYLHDYARRYSSNASTMLKNTNPDLWNKAKIISDKYKIFTL